MGPRRQAISFLRLGFYRRTSKDWGADDMQPRLRPGQTPVPNLLSTRYFPRLLWKTRGRFDGMFESN